jgi:hypothetical protein
VQVEPVTTKPKTTDFMTYEKEWHCASKYLTLNNVINLYPAVAPSWPAQYIKYNTGLHS